MKVYVKNLGERSYIKPHMRDCDGWLDTTQYLPAEFDIVQTQDANGQVRNLWFDGEIFDGVKVLEQDEVIRWKPLY